MLIPISLFTPMHDDGLMRSHKPNEVIFGSPQCKKRQNNYSCVLRLRRSCVHKHTTNQYYGPFDEFGIYPFSIPESREIYTLMTSARWSRLVASVHMDTQHGLRWTTSRNGNVKYNLRNFKWRFKLRLTLPFSIVDRNFTDRITIIYQVASAKGLLFTNRPDILGTSSTPKLSHRAHWAPRYRWLYKD